MYTIGDEVRYTLTGQYGIVKNVVYMPDSDLDVDFYEVEIDGVIYDVREEELN